MQGLLESGEENYGERTLDQFVLGNYSDDATLLGTAAQVGLSLADLDLPMDVRDLTYDLTNWEWTPEHIAQTLLDAVGSEPTAAGGRGREASEWPQLRDFKGSAADRIKSLSCNRESAVKEQKALVAIGGETWSLKSGPIRKKSRTNLLLGERADRRR